MKMKAMLAVLAAGALLVTGCSNSSTTTTSTEAKTEAKTETEAAAATEETTEAAEAEEIVTEAAAEDAETEAGNESVAESIGDITVGEVETEEETEEDVTEIGPRASYTALDYVTVGEYKGLPVEVEPIEITEEEIDDAISSAIETADAYEEVTEGTVEDGDIANIDYVGTKDGEAFDGGTAEGTDLTIGSGTFIDGFEEGLIGVAVGETVELNLTFPESYWSEDLAGADVVFTVTVNYVKRTPEVTDELISTMTDGEYTTVEAYREYQKETLTQSAEASRESTVQNELMTLLYNTCTVSGYPEEVVEYETARAIQYYSTYAAYYGYELEDFISAMYGMDLETFETSLDTSIRSSLDQELILCAIFETEGLELTDELYEQYCAQYAEESGMESTEAFKEYYDENLIKASIKSEMAMDVVYENAVITEVETEAVTEAVEEEAVSENAEESVAEQVTE